LKLVKGADVGSLYPGDLKLFDWGPTISKLQLLADSLWQWV